jgi:E3 ubiquitin-protein ligase makorin
VSVIPSKTTVRDTNEGSLSYAAAAKDPNAIPEEVHNQQNEPLCPYSVANYECPNQSNCNYLHGLLCDLCNRSCLHPFNEKQQKQHHEECVKEHERQMELSFAIQRSMDKTCGICMDIVMEKEPVTERRFGVLEKCTHIFCLSCIRKWRQTKQFDSRTIRSCPECRVSSDFVIPSEFWVEEKEDKDKLITDYKKALGSKPCKYFKQGRGECPFAGACFYLHAYPDGTKATMPPPRPRTIRTNADGERESLMDVLLWNYLEQRNDPSWLMTLDWDDLLDMRDLGLLSTDDESDSSDYDFAF